MVVLSTAGVLLVGCEVESSCMMQGKSPEIVAHRGASEEAPENTVAAFVEAWRQGADAIEGDFRMTRDGSIVCMHDETLLRTTGDPRSVADVTLEEIRALDAGSWKDRRFVGEPVPTLEEVFDAVPSGKGILVEVKIGPEIVPALVDVIHSSALQQDQITVIAFDRDFVRALKDVRPSTRVLLLTSFEDRGGTWSPSAAQLSAQAVELGVEGVDVKAIPEVVDAEFVERCHNAGLEVHVWTVDSPDRARHMAAASVDSITTNRPGDLREEIASDDS